MRHSLDDFYLIATNLDVDRLDMLFNFHLSLVGKS
jgi:hypothetical protein